MSALLHDLQHAFRSLRAAPLTTAAILVIALGTGANVAVFAVTYGVLIRPLPYPDAGRLAILSVAPAEGADLGVPFAEVDDWRRRLRAVEAVAGYAIGERTLRGAGEPRLTRTAFVTPAFFDVLGVGPARWWPPRRSRRPGCRPAARRASSHGSCCEKNKGTICTVLSASAGGSPLQRLRCARPGRSASRSTAGRSQLRPSGDPRRVAGRHR